MKIFGWEITLPQEQDYPSFSPPVHDDGAVTVAAGGSFGTYIDLEGAIKNEAELVSKYRQMINHHEINTAITNISNEAIVQEEGQDIVDIVLDDLEEELKPPVIKAIQEEFQNVLELLKWNTHAKDIFQRWYVDGRLYFHAIIDEKMTQAGIQELRYIDPRKIRKVRELEQKKDPEQMKMPGADLISKIKNEYFVFNPRGFVANANPSYQYSSPTQGLKIAKDSVVHVTSGVMNDTGSLVLSHLHKAIKPLNQLRALEDAAIIYRLARAPERRVFYVDTGTLPQIKAQQYVQSLMAKYKNKLVYDSATGEIRDDRKMMTMLEDFWLPRREGGKGTEITTLEGGNAQGVIEEVDYFKQRLYESLDVPYSRSDPGNSMFQGGMGTAEISRDEINFGMFIDNVRIRFNLLFLEILRKQLILKQIIQPQEWDHIAYKTRFSYARNNLFSEIKEREVINGRMTTVQLMAPYVGRYYSNNWLRKHILKQTDEDIEKMDLEIMEELQNPLYQAPLGMPAGEDPNMMGGDEQEGQPDMSGLSAQPPIDDGKSINKAKPKSKKAA